MKREMTEQMTTDILFQPLTIADLRLPNRAMMTTIKQGYSTSHGEVTERHIVLYVRRAEGEVGRITTEPLWIHPTGREIPTQLGIYDDALVPGLHGLADAIHTAWDE
jgi:NADPH2 dehydrogenase